MQYNRMAEFVCHVSQHYSDILVDHYVDDVWILEPEGTIDSAFEISFGIRELFGFKVELVNAEGVPKAYSPRFEVPLLGVVLCLPETEEEQGAWDFEFELTPDEEGPTVARPHFGSTEG